MKRLKRPMLGFGSDNYHTKGMLAVITKMNCKNVDVRVHIHINV